MSRGGLGSPTGLGIHQPTSQAMSVTAAGPSASDHRSVSFACNVANKMQACPGPRVLQQAGGPPMARIASGVELTRAQSLQFAMEFEDELAPQSATESIQTKLAVDQLWRLMACKTPVERQMQHLIHDTRDERAGGEALTSAALAQAFEAQGYETCMRTALGGGDGIDCLHNLRHSFLVVRPPGSGVGEPFYIVDIEFKDQFRVAASTSHYQSLMDNLEPEFVGTEQKLRPVLKMLCDEMALAFADQDIVLPPWRQVKSMLSKWCPRRSEDFLPDGTRSKTVMEEAAAAASLDIARSSSYLKGVEAALATVGPLSPFEEQQKQGGFSSDASAPHLPWEMPGYLMPQ